eukprot:gene21556-28549_t
MSALGHLGGAGWQQGSCHHRRALEPTVTELWTRDANSAAFELPEPAIRAREPQDYQIWQRAAGVLARHSLAPLWSKKPQIQIGTSTELPRQRQTPATGGIGPNTGGKTVTLKTVGLLSVMAKAGMFLPIESHDDAPPSLVWADYILADI